MTKVVNIHKEDYDVYMGRKGKGKDGYFGNPYTITSNAQRGSSLEKFKDYFYTRIQIDNEYKEKIQALKGLTLGCFCKPHPCHVDIIKEYLDSGFVIPDKYQIF